MKDIQLIPSALSVPIEQNTVLSVFLLAFLLFLSVFILLRRTKLFGVYFGGFYSDAKMQKYIEDQQNPKLILPFPFLTIGLNFFLAGVIIYWYLWDFIDLDDYLISSFLIAGMMNLLPYIHHLVIRIMGGILKLPAYAEKHALIAHYTLHLTAFLSIPLFLYFLNSREIDTHFVQLYANISIILVTVYYVVRTFILFYKPSLVAWFYIFIYLCTLEVVPLTLIFKVITETYS